MSYKYKSSEKRLENKKRKAQAFLNLIKSQNEIPEQDDLSPTSLLPEAAENKQPDGTKETAAVKKARMSGPSPGKKIKISVIDVSTDSEVAQCKKEEETDEVLAEARRVLRERQKAAMQKPKIFLTLDELTRDSPFVNQDGVKEAPPLVMLDVQHLLLFGLLGNRASIKPRWCRLLRTGKVSKVVAVVIDSVSRTELEHHPDSLPTLRQAFDLDADMIPPVHYGSSVREDLLNVQISKTQLRRQLKTLTGKDAEELRNELISLSAQQKEEKDRKLLTEQAEQEQKSGESLDEFDRRGLMLSSSQILHEGIPMPYGFKQYRDFVFSKDTYTDVTSSSPLFAVDCEMVQSTANAMDLARVSIVNEDLETVYDTFVKPRARIIDYVTKFSGITKKIMDGCKTYLEDVQRHIQNILPSDAILCGQSIGSDLRSMKMFHPYIIDTSVIFNLTGKRRMKSGLKRLSAHFLNQDIQNSSQGHSSVEDASATMELVKLKLINGIDFGDLAWTGEVPSQSYPNTDTTNCDNQTRERDGSSTHVEDTSEEGRSDKLNSVNSVCKTSSTNEIMSKRRLFFHQGTRSTEFFLKNIEHFHRRGVLLEEPSSKDHYPESESVLYVDTDKQRQKRTVACLRDKDFCLTYLYGYRDLLSSSQSEGDATQEKRKCLWKLDKKIGKIMTKIPANSLFVVILSGYRDHSAKVFCKITDGSSPT